MTKKASKGGVRRKNETYPGLKKELHPRTRWEYMDQDYFNKLSNTEKAFMSKFMEEYYGASFATKDDYINRENDLHKSDALRKDCEHRNNSRNRDIYSINRT